MSLPKKIYVKEEQDEDITFLIADYEPKDISESDSSIFAGEYVLQREIEITNKTEIKDAVPF